MVKPDVKHNYYADLDLPTTATLDDVRKAYRKLALQYHPDRNSGREDECVPKFQAIQAANEVLGDSALKQKYDTDRRKAGLYPAQAFRPTQPAPGNPYTATSAYPPPPRRTQPGTWQRPPPAPGAAPGPAPGAAPGPGATGADRFSYFPKPSPTARKDAAQDRTNMFKAWQNMNSPQDRQQRPFHPVPPQPPPQAPPQPAPGPQAQPPPQARRPPPQVPPRDKPLPTEEQIRAGMRHKAAAPRIDPDAINERQTAWQAFQANTAGKPGLGRSNTAKAPRKQGFNPNAPVSDERPAPKSESHYVHRNKSADFGRAKFPPPPPGGPPSATPTSPLSPNPSRPVSHDTDVPFAEGNRIRTPYTNFIGERTDFSGERMRRSHSTRDTTKLDPTAAARQGRARSSSPARKSPVHSEDTPHKPFVVYSSSSDTEDNDVDEDGTDQPAKGNTRPGTAPESTTSNRPQKTPVPRSKRFNGNAGGAAASTSVPNGADGTASENDTAPNMQQKDKPNMYAMPSLSSATLRPVSSSHSTCGAGDSRSEPVPSTASSTMKARLPEISSHAAEEYVTAADETYIRARGDEKQAYQLLQAGVNKEFDYVPSNLDMGIFLELASSLRRGTVTGNPALDRILAHVLLSFPHVGYDENTTNRSTDRALDADSFAFPRDPELFAPTNAKSRSEENVNTNFSPDGWSGTFSGGSEYFTPPQTTTKKTSSPSRQTSSRATSSPNRAATLDVPPTSAPDDSQQQRPWGSDGRQKPFAPLSAEPGETKFSKEEWEKTFQDPSWTFPPPPPNPPSPNKASAGAGMRRASGGRWTSKAAGKRTPVGVRLQTSAESVGEDEALEMGEDGNDDHTNTIDDDADAMDIDNTPPAHATSAKDQENDARLYAVPKSSWREQQEQQRRQQSTRTPASGPVRRPVSDGVRFNTDLDDLRNVEPFASNNTSNGSGLKNMAADMSSTLPFTPQASSTLPTRANDPKSLQLPLLPVPAAPPQKVTRASWQAYTTSFAKYLRAYHEFNATLLGHFTAREAQEQQANLGDMSWLQQVGDTSTGKGFGAYMSHVKEDEVVRETWNAGCEKHKEALLVFQSVREMVKRLAAAGILQDG